MKTEDRLLIYSIGHYLIGSLMILATILMALPGLIIDGWEGTWFLIFPGFLFIAAGLGFVAEGLECNDRRKHYIDYYLNRKI